MGHGPNGYSLPTVEELMDRGDIAMAECAVLIDTLRDNIDVAQRLRERAWTQHEHQDGAPPTGLDRGSTDAPAS